jgi:[glutamine synthetase] adenylyltransferase / [glutamine synthetase]-adenylyl-L-tyrosine phosphorylase
MPWNPPAIHDAALAGRDRQAWTGPAGSADWAVGLGQYSRAAWETAQGDPERFAAEITGTRWRSILGRRNLAEELGHALAGIADREERRSAACRFKRWQDLRITLGDCCGALGFAAVISELSDLADVLIGWACAEACDAVRHRCGGLDPATGFAVLGMGKLGGRELNYSSDIDLIFLYVQPDDVDLHPIWCRLGAELVRCLDEPTAAGRLYRVDMRLRPQGDQGELALSRRELLDYYWTVGRPWERQAMIKARCVAGAMALGENVLADLASWVYPADPPIEVLDEARTMRRRIEERAREADLKTGAGGIRDIEFLVQYFQLLYGGRHRDLRGRATLPVLRELAVRRILPRADADDLERDYVRLRTAEHRLQQWEDRQEHAIPADADGQRSLAGRCGWMDEDATSRFLEEIQTVRARVRGLAATHFLTVPQEHDAFLSLVVQGGVDAGLAQRLLAPIGFTDVPAAAKNLARLAHEPFFLLSRDRTERSLVAILPLVLHLIGQSPEPDRTLDNLRRIIESVGGRATFYDLLGQRPRALELLTSFAGWATFLVDLFDQQPGLADEVIDALATRPKPAAALRGEATALVHGLSDPAAPLGLLMGRELAVTAIHDLDGWTIDLVAERLTALAEAVLDAVLGRVIAERVRSWGAPLEAGRPTRYAVIGLGKLGGRELSYASDMDVVLVCDPGGACPRADRGGEEFWLRVAQDLGRILHEGRLYDLDTRLRPWGDQGDPVTTTATLARYWAEPRDLWERLAMVRAAHRAGDPRLGQEAVRTLRQAAIGAPLPASAAADVRAMRQRLEASVAGRDHVKRGPGGYVDVEFIAQYRVLGCDPSTLPTDLGTIPTLRWLAAQGRIPPACVEPLTGALRLLRAVESRQRLATGRAVSALPTTPAERLGIARRCGHDSVQAFDAALQEARQVARAWFDRLIV